MTSSTPRTTAPPTPAPRVSVVVSTFDRPRALAELVESLSRQSFRDFEVIIVNDAGASLDPVVAPYPELRLRVLYQAVNGGPTKAINAGIQAAQGEFITLCDDDDLLAPCHLGRLVDRLLQGEADLVYADAEIFSFENVGGHRVPTERRVWALDFDRSVLQHFSTIIPSGTTYRKALHQHLGAMDESLPVYWDWDFMIRLQEARGRVERVPVASVAYAFGTHNTTADPSRNLPYLRRLEAKHGLEGLKASNFHRLLDEPDLQAWHRPTERVWDGHIRPSRLGMMGPCPASPPPASPA